MLMKVIDPGHKIDVSDKLKTEMSNAMTQTHCVNTTTKRSKRKSVEKMCKFISVSAQHHKDHATSEMSS